MIEQAVTGKGDVLEPPAGHEHVVDAPVDLLGREQHGKAADHRGADAGAAEDIEVRAALRKGFEHADMGRAEPAAAGGDVAGRASGQEAMQALEVEVVLQRDVVVHPHVTPGEPGGGALDPAGARSCSRTSRRRAGGWVVNAKASTGLSFRVPRRKRRSRPGPPGGSPCGSNR